MNYILKNVSFIGSPKNVDEQPNKSQFYLNVTTGISGDIYDFVKVDTTSFIFDKSLTGVQIQALAETTAQTFVTANYPNT